jgi:hypothetical protein
MFGADDLDNLDPTDINSVTVENAVRAAKGLAPRTIYHGGPITGGRGIGNGQGVE